LEIQHVLEGDDAAVEDVKNGFLERTDRDRGVQRRAVLVQRDYPIVVLRGFGFGILELIDRGRDGFQCPPIIGLVVRAFDPEFSGIGQIAIPFQIDAASPKDCAKLEMGRRRNLGGGGR